MEVFAVGGVSFEPLLPAATTIVANVAVRGALGRWGLLLDGGFDTPRNGNVDAIEVSAATQWLSLSLSVGFRPTDWFSFDVALGVRGWRLSGTSSGFEGATSNELFAAGGVFSTGLNLRLAGPLHAQVRPWASLRGQRADFTVQPLGTVLAVNPVSFGVLVGLMLRFG